MTYRIAYLTVWAVASCFSAFAQDQPLAHPVIEFSRPVMGKLRIGTMMYQPTTQEKAYLRKQQQDQAANAKSDATQSCQLASQIGRYVGWFGIVRQRTWDKEKGVTSLLLEHKYFDGLTDLHLQVVSIYGAGDFTVRLPIKAENIPLLGLVRVYGKVSNDHNGMPSISPEYIRIWEWGLFTFMDYNGELDKTNPEWLKLRKVNGKDAYSLMPTRQFYEERLGTTNSSNQNSEQAH